MIIYRDHMILFNYTTPILLYIRFKNNIKHQVHYQQSSYIPNFFSLHTGSHLRKDNDQLSSELQKNCN